MKKKYFIALLVLMVICVPSYSQKKNKSTIENTDICLFNIGTLWESGIRIDGQKVNKIKKSGVILVNPGKRTIAVIGGKFDAEDTFDFKPGGYYSLSLIDWKNFTIVDNTDLVLNGRGATYDYFSEAEKNAGITRLVNGIGKIRAPNEKSDYNFGVHNYSPNISKYATIRIKASDGLLVIKKYNNDDVNWYGNSKGGVVVIPSGKYTLILDYLAPRHGSPDASLLTNTNTIHNTLGDSVGLIAFGFQALSNAIKRGKADDRDTSNIYVNYEFFPGAEYEISFVKNKKKGAPYAEVEVIPKKGAPKGQPNGHGTVLSYEDITAANSAAEAKKMQIRYSVAVNGKQTGPYSYDELRQLVSKGELTKDSLVWKEGMQQWAAAGTVDELADIWTSVPPPLPPPLP